MSGPVIHRFRVTGRVQGVGFRWFVREQARALGVRGWVQNEPDGSVVTEVAGAAEAVHALRDAVSRGPVGAHVTAVSASEPPEDDLVSLPMPFSVRR